MKRFQAAAVAACVATAVFATPAEAASLKVEGSVCALYLETTEEESVARYFTSHYPKYLTDGSELAGVYLSVAEAKDRYREMAQLTDADFTTGEFDRFNTPEEIAAFHKIRALTKQCVESTQHQAQNGSSATAAIAISALALVVSLAGLALPFAKDFLPV
ncbi:hypothetical protein [Corynebacterium riegelii]|uniref:hypothetical protein n=1 Tax=Corynebacterium riegelii TaxID=156976 RepID=UPI0023F75491|nr:hypothetical protein [Corynebacterium riegelii]